MKQTLLFVVLFICIGAGAQQQVQSLPAGKYETRLNNSKARWTRGDLALQGNGQYTFGDSKEAGDYKFSVAAQRIFFTSGPLKGMYATTTMQGQTPVIIFPRNDAQPISITEDVYAFFRQ